MLTMLRTQSAVCLVLLFICACNEQPAPFKPEDRSPKAKHDAPFDPPRTYPEWAYDSEKYMRPAEELKPEPRVRPEDPLHYFTNKKIVMIAQPADYTPEEVPRIAVWWTEDNGFHWNKAGYFGRQQSHFPFEADEDGDYGVRFVGPGQSTAEEVPPSPERVYHVDTLKPEVEVKIDPEKSWYKVGETITISWQASDHHLIEYPVRVSVFGDFAASERELNELQRDLADEGSITYRVPATALDHELRFRVDAMDRAGNVGTAISYALQVVDKGDLELKDVSQSEKETAAPSESTSMPPAANADPNHGPKPGAEPAADGSASADEPRRTDVPDLAAADQPLAARTPLPEDSDLLNWDGPFFISSPKVEANRVVMAAESDTVAMAEEASLPVETSTEPEPAPTAEQIAEAPPPTYDEDAAATDLLTDKPSRIDAPPAPARPGDSTQDLGLLRRFAISGQPISTVDVTRGNRLLVPLPATVEPQPRTTAWVSGHPWRMLGPILAEPLECVWVLPRPRFSLELYHAVEGRFLADHPFLRPVSEPAASDQALAGAVTDEQ